MVGSGSGSGSLGVGATALPPDEPPEDEPPPEEFPEEAPPPPFAEPEPVAFEPEVFGLPRTPAPRRVPSSRIRAQRPRPVLVGAAKPEPPSSDALRPPSSRRSAGSDSAPASVVEAVSSDVALVAPGPFASPAPEGPPPGAGKAMHAHKRRIRTERSCAIGARPLSHKRALFRQRRDGTGVHDNAHCHKRERKREKPAQQRGYGRAPKGTPRIGPAMKGQFHRSRSFSHKDLVLCTSSR